MRQLAQLIQQHRRAVLLAWALIVFAGAAATPFAMVHLDSELLAPKGSPSALAAEALQALDPNGLGSPSREPIVALIQCNTSILTAPANETAAAVSDAIVAAAKREAGANGLRSFGSYHYALREGLPQGYAKHIFVSDDELSMIAFVDVRRDGHAVARRLLAQMPELVQSVTSPGDAPVDATLLSVLLSYDEVDLATKMDMGIIDAVSIPFALVVLTLTLRSWRLVLLPALLLPVVGLSSMLFLAALVNLMTVMQAALGVMTSVLIATSFDYGLFLLSRLREVSAAESPEVAVAEMLSTAGYTVLVSSATFCVSSMGLLCVPSDLARQFGACLAIVTTVAASANLTLLPALILSCPSFFLPKPAPPNERTKLTAAMGGKLLEGQVSSDDFAASRWYQLGQVITRSPWNWLTVLAVLGATAPFLPFCFGQPKGVSIQTMAPPGRLLSALERVDKAHAGVSGGRGFQLIVVPDDNVEVLSKDFFEASRRTLDSFAEQAPPLTCKNITGISSASCGSVPVAIWEPCVQHGSWGANVTPADFPSCELMQGFYNMSVLPHNAAVVNQLDMHLDMGSDEAGRWYRRALAATANLSSTPGIAKVFLFSQSMGPLWDATLAINDSFPLMLTVTAAAIFVLMGFSFRSLVIPGRAVLTVLTTLCFTYGLASLVYVHGILDWTESPGLSKLGELHFLPPVVDLPVVMGLAVDYDVFLLTRVHEYWRSGCDTREAICRGLAKSGGIITAAGAIMAAAFAGMLFATTPVTNQVGFYLLAAVLYDTLVVRALLVPSLFSIAAETNWWPGGRRRPASDDSLHDLYSNGPPSLARVLLFPFVALYCAFAGTYSCVIRLTYTCVSCLDLRRDRSVAEVAEGRKGEMPVDVFDPETCDWDYLQKAYVREDVPFVLHPADALCFSLRPPEEAVRSLTPGVMRLAYLRWCTTLPGVDRVVARLFPLSGRASPPLWFLGDYKAGCAHMDVLLPCKNVYCLTHGCKDVVILTRKDTQAANLVFRKDHWYVPGSEGASRDWLQRFERHYRVVLRPNSILVTSSCSCVHHFVNMPSHEKDGALPAALSLRVHDTRGTDWRAVMALFFPAHWWCMAGHGARGALVGGMEEEKTGISVALS